MIKRETAGHTHTEESKMSKAKPRPNIREWTRSELEKELYQISTLRAAIWREYRESLKKELKDRK